MNKRRKNGVKSRIRDANEKYLREEISWDDYQVHFLRYYNLFADTEVAEMIKVGYDSLVFNHTLWQKDQERKKHV